MRATVELREPDPAFAAQLRSRLARAFELPKGVTVSNLTIDEATEASQHAALALSVTPYLAVAGAERALSFYAEAFGARTLGEPIVMPDGRIGHAEIDIDGVTIMLSDEHPEIGVEAPRAGSGASVTLLLTVSDVDGVIERAVGAGAVLDRPAADYDYGRNGVVRDPFGHRWMISAPPAAVRTAAAAVAPGRRGPRHGDIGYVSLFVPDLERATRFYSSVLGWVYGPASGTQGRQVEGLNLHHGLSGDEERSTLFLCFAVDDIDAAVQRVRAAGGTAEEPHDEPYGVLSACTDDDGVRFALYEPTADASFELPERNPRQGDLEYVTMQARSSAVARSFYGEVLGWHFAPGNVEDGWQVENVTPLVGIASGHAVTTAVPMYRVDDIAAAVGRVRAAGGTATDPESAPYGLWSRCGDDQGTEFYLGQLP
jgi:uncharacterized glyoxalase superfamily protein PhnB